MSSPATLFSCVDSNSICKSPLNKSSAKKQYSFSKDSRFKAPSPYCDTFYEIPNTISNRKTAIGFGKKTDLDVGKHRHNKSPPPHYDIPSFVDTNQEHAKGSTIHIGREVDQSSIQKTKPRSYIELDRIKFPGPGRYEEFKIRDTPRWSMRPLVDNHLFPNSSNTSFQKDPGPGTHDSTSDLHKQGKYYISKHKSSMSKVWNPKTSQRFYKSTTDVPGSGTYNPECNDLSDSGKYVLSKFEGAGKRKFGISFRDSFVDKPSKQTKTPGPGTYRLPSDFGQYDQVRYRGGQKLMA